MGAVVLVAIGIVLRKKRLPDKPQSKSQYITTESGKSKT